MNDVTVVVTTFNRADGLAKTLAALLVQTTTSGFDYEVVVVNDGSTDHTESVIAEASARSPRLRHITIENSGVSKARDVGVNASQAEWIAFCDDDQIPEPHWLNALYAVATANNAACVGGPTTLTLPPSCTLPLTPNARRLLGEDDFGPQVRPYPGRALPSTGNVMLRREVFDRVGGFDTKFHEGGEDAELFLRVSDAGLRILYSPNALMHHVIPESRLRPEFLQWVAGRIGVADARISHKHHTPLAIAWRVIVRIGLLGTRDLWNAAGGIKSGRGIDASCSRAYTAAYLHGLLHFFAPESFHSGGLLNKLNFRHHGGDRKSSVA
jgi:GT2 family glycosyltransferase